MLKIYIVFFFIFCFKHNFSCAYFARFQGEGTIKFRGGVHFIGKFDKGKAVEVSIWIGSFHIKVSERGTVRVKCLAEERDTVFTAIARTVTGRYGDETTSHEVALIFKRFDMITPK